MRAPNCPHWILGAAAAFAGPILALISLDSCGINLSGLSTSGKTLAQKLAVSAWTSPRIGVGLLQSLRTTENAVESLAQASTGTVLALDEMAHIEGQNSWAADLFDRERAGQSAAETRTPHRGSGPTGRPSAS